MSFGAAPKTEVQQEGESLANAKQEPLLPTTAENLTYESAQKAIGLKVETFDGDRNLIFIHGKEENLEKIFRTLIDKLGTKQMDHEAVDNWAYVRSGKHLRPGGTYAVTLMAKDENPKLMVQNVNAKNFEPINKPMHEAVEFSIMEAAKKIASTE